MLSCLSRLDIFVVILAVVSQVLYVRIHHGFNLCLPLFVLIRLYRHVLVLLRDILILRLCCILILRRCHILILLGSEFAADWLVLGSRTRFARIVSFVQHLVQLWLSWLLLIDLFQPGFPWLLVADVLQHLVQCRLLWLRVAGLAAEF